MLPAKSSLEMAQSVGKRPDKTMTRLHHLPIHIQLPFLSME